MTAPEAPLPEEHHGLEHLILDRHPLAVRVTVILWVIALSLFLAYAVAPLREIVDRIDQRIYDLTFPIKWGPLTGLAYTLDFIGSWFIVWPLRIAVAIYFGVRRRWIAFAVWVTAIAVSDPLIGILKLVYERPRPTDGLVEEITYSFPSGHSVAGAVVAISLVLCLVKPGPARRNLEIGAGIFALGMGGSRMYLGAHWFTDVAAGVALGAACAIGAAAAVQWYADRRSRVAAG
jgi:undecaprenyl-diphosphatase